MKRAAPRRIGAYDPTSDAMAPAEYHIQAMVEGLDELAHTMERKWGVGRLRLLVSDLLRAKFDEQKDRLNAALASDQERFIRIQVDAMRRAWAALDQAAIADGEKPLSPLVWECVLPSTGEIVSLVRTDAEAHHIARECRVFTLAEIATLIEGLGDTVLDVKKQFPGAAVTDIRRKPPINWEHGDEIPF